MRAINIILQTKTATEYKLSSSLVTFVLPVTYLSAAGGGGAAEGEREPQSSDSGAAHFSPKGISIVHTGMRHLEWSLCPTSWTD